MGSVYMVFAQILVESWINQQIGQLPFKHRKEKYRDDSVIHHPLNVIHCEKRGPEKIDVRSAELAGLIIKVWPL
ncbi:hypothetical protein [Deinococcus aerophilus]|uniref:Uncharacterized protein n=1 Tax=Deinococcus aerophilus TaxID=522488 RepID=A0ABQ2H1I1_9DEIO|nr:hypothetical protein [Deinococcus aerophilus]GGM21868.1 hypothetical protein GCM10010841_32170 [Deinococcus aerophilus]